VYELRARRGERPDSDRRQPGKRGPKTALSDEELLQEIRAVLKASPFLGEGHRKVKARLVAKGIRAGKNRVLRLMREHGLPAPVRRGRPRGDRSHGGRIRTERPDELWGRDASRFWTKAEGWCWFFAAVDHCTSEVVGWHAAKKGDRWAALEPVRQGVRAQMGGFGKAIALGLGLRQDWGSQYRARQLQAEIKWLGIRSTPAYVGEPECNGVAERFIRTLKEERIYLHHLETLEEARVMIGTFIERYNNGWLLQRHGVHDPGPCPREAQPTGGLMLQPSTCPENPVRYRPSLRLALQKSTFSSLRAAAAPLQCGLRHTIAATVRSAKNRGGRLRRNNAGMHREANSMPSRRISLLRCRCVG